MLISLIHLAAFAQPTNDSFSAAEIISGLSGTVAGSNIGATSETGEPTHAGVPVGASIWYKWVAPIGGDVTFDTFGSDFDTVLAVYVGPSVSALNEIASNDDIANIGGPSRVQFTATSGVTYYVAVDGYSMDEGISALNWQLTSPLSAGSFEFTSQIYYAGERESSGTLDGFNTVDPSTDGARVTVTRRGGFKGKTTLDCVVAPYYITNIYYTNVLDSTNLFWINIIDSLYATFDFTNNFSGSPLGTTNINIVRTSPGGVVTNISVTNVFGGTALRASYPVTGVGCMSTNLGGGSSNTFCLTTNGGIIFSASYVRPTGFSTNFSLIITNTGVTNISLSISNVNGTSSNITWVIDTFTTNIFAAYYRGTNATFFAFAADPVMYTAITTNVIPVGGFITNSLVFDDYQMSASFTVPIGNNFSNNVNRTRVMTLTNVALATNELTSISAPTIDPGLGASVLTILDDDSYPGATTLNIERATFRTTESGKGLGFARIYVIRSGNLSGTPHCLYRINYRPPANANNIFEIVNRLQAGSDYTTPNSDYTPVSGTLTWADGDPFAFIDVPILEDNLVEFNEDMLIEIYKEVGNPVTIGNIFYATLTIHFDDQPAGAVDRDYNKDKSPDTFPPHNATPGANKTVYSLAIQPDNKTVLAGDFSSFNTTSRGRIARALSNGQIDTSFNPGSGADAFISKVLLQTNGSILIGGAFTSFNGTARRGLARLNATGALDASFNPGVGANGTVWAMDVQPDGKVLVAGEFTTVNGVSRPHVARLNSDGSVDSTFNAGTGPNNTVFDVKVQPDGNILIGGDFTSINSTNRSRLARLTTTGAIDPTFNVGSGADDTVYALAIQADGKIMVGGAFRSINLLGSAKISRLNVDGTVDTTFDAGTGADDTIYSIALQGDGRAVVGGIFTSINGTRRIGIARFLSNGILDTGFMDCAYNQFAGVPNPYYNPLVNPKNYIFTVGLQADGNVLIGGGFSRVGGGGSRDDIHNRSNFARLIGGDTAGPGDLSLVYDNYNADENNEDFYVTLTRENGSLGPAQASFSTLTFPPGPGAAVDGVNFTFDSGKYGAPKYISTWPNTRMHSDAHSGPNYGTNPGSDDVYIKILKDGVVAPDSKLQLELSSPVFADIFDLAGENIPLGLALGRTKATLTILDSDLAPGTLSFSKPEFFVDEGGTNALITVVRTGGSDGIVHVDYSTSDGTALNGTNYLATSGTLTLLGGVTSNTFFVPLVDNSNVEDDPTLNVHLSNPTGGADIGLADATLTVIDNDVSSGRVNFTFTTYSTNENAGFAVVEVTRTGGSRGTLSVQFATQDGSAVSGVNYSSVSTNLVWASGDTASKLILIPIADNQVVDSDKTVDLSLSNPLVNGSTPSLPVLGIRSTAELTIVNDDSYGFVDFTASGYRVNENGGNAVISVIRTGGIAESITVNYATGDASAVANADYVPVSGSLVFGPGEVSKTFQVPIVNNLTPDASRFFTVSIFGETPTGTLGSISLASVTIIDDETINETPGAIDTSFNPTAGGNDFIYSIALQPDGKMLVGGDFTAINGTSRNRIARLTADGSLDSKFATAAVGANGSVRSIVIQSDDKILIGGLFSNVNNTNRSYITRLTYDGSTDATFNPGAGADNPVYAIAETFVDGLRKIVVGGAFGSFNGVGHHSLIRLNNNGTVDSTFDSGGTGADGTVYAVALQTDGKILIGGDFNTYNGVIRHGIARLNADGTLDTSFLASGSGADGSVRAIAIQPDGRIVLGGLFTNVNDTAINYVARLESDGSLDSSFTPGVGANGPVLCISVQNDGSILLGGSFTRFGDVSRSRITRLNASGVVDPTINFGFGADDFVSSIVVQPGDDKIVLVGGFTHYDGFARSHIARIYGRSIAGSGQLEFSATHYYVDENGTNALITLRRRGGTSEDLTNGPVSVTFSTADGTAVAGINYTAVVTNVPFPAGEVIQSVTIPILNDQLVEDDRILNLNLSSPQGGAALGDIATADLTIVKANSAVSFAASSFQVNEGAVNGAGLINIVRTGSTNGTVIATFSTLTNGTATAGLRYTPVTTNIVFGPGETNVVVLIPVIDNTLVDGNVTVECTLENVIGGILLQPSLTTLTILDNDFSPGILSFANIGFSVNEDATNAVVTVVRTNGFTGAVSVQYSANGGTATGGRDYMPTNGILVFADGETNKTFLVRVYTNGLVTGDLTVDLTLYAASGGATIAGATTVPLTIVDQDIGFAFTSPAYFVNEADPFVTISVRRFNGTNSAMTIDYSTADASAAAVSDYQDTHGQLTFSVGETVKTFSVPISNDGIVEGNELFFISLSNPSANTQLTFPSTASVTIVDNDTGIHFSTNVCSVAKNGTNIALTVVRDNPNTGPVTVSFASTNGTAIAGVDYIATNGILSFADGEAAKTIMVPIIDDLIVTGDRTFTVTLINTTGGAQVLQPVQTTVTITETHSGLAFSAGNYQVRESGVSATISVIRTNAFQNTVTVDYATANGAGSIGRYISNQGTLTFGPGESNKTFVVTVVDDTQIQGDGTVLLKLSNTTGGALLVAPSAATLTILDDDGSVIVAAGTTLLSESFAPANNVIDPGETIQMLFALRDAGNNNTTNLVATLLATNGVVSPSAPQSYGQLVVGGPSVSRPFSFTANGTNGQRITATLKIYDTNQIDHTAFALGVVTFNFIIGDTANRFTNINFITINDNAAATPYPSTITVSGIDGVISKATLTLSNVAHTFPKDIDVLLVGPAGQKVSLLSHVGSGYPITNVTLTFDDTAVNYLAPSNPIVSGTYKPTVLAFGSFFASPAPPGPYSTNLASFNGTNPNGSWSLYVVDDTSFNMGSIGGWSLSLTTTAPVTSNADVLVATKTAPLSVIVSNLFTNTVTLTNYGPSTATGVILTNTIPLGATLISVSLSQGSYVVDTNASAVISTIGSLLKDGNATASFVFRADATGVMTNFLSAFGNETEPNSVNNYATSVTTVNVPSADLALGFSATPNPVTVGDTLTFTIAITNLGPAPAVGVFVTNSLPAGASSISVTGATSSVTATSVVCNLGTIASGSSVNFLIQCRPTVVGSYTNIVNVGSSTLDPFKSNNLGSVKTIVELPLIAFARNGTNVVLTWPLLPNPLILESADTLPSPWTVVNGAVVTNGQASYTVPAIGTKYFRLRAP